MTSGFLCHPAVYSFEGWRMEERHIGERYWPLRKDDEPYKRVPSAYWPVYERFMALSEDERGEFVEQYGRCEYVEL